jgi:predicted cobalt transporter CbtA
MTKLLHRLDPARPRTVVLGAILLGMAAGLVAAAFLTITGEPRIEDAIRLEHAHLVHEHVHEEVLVSRGVQKGPGLFGAYVLSGGGFGLLFGIAFLGLGRGRPDVFRRALLAGGVLAGAFTVAPWLKYPPDPPGVGNPATLADRQRIYVALILLTLAVLVGATHLARRLRDRGWDEPRRVAAVVAVAVVVMLAVVGLLPPAPDKVEVPATLVWQFRLASLGGNLLLWGCMTFGFGVAATSRRADRRPALVG